MKNIGIKAVDFARRAARRALADTARVCGRMAGRLESRPILTAEEQALLDRNKELAGRYQGRRAFVVGNGPSLKKQNLDLLDGELIFVSNGFWRHPILEKIQPVSLALCDPAYFEGKPEWDYEFQGILKSIRTGIFLVPRIVRPLIRARRLLPEERAYYCEFYGEMARLSNFTYDLSRPLPNCQTVTLFSIMIAMHMGCNPVYLLGMDHDFLVTPSKATHFYQDENEPMSDNCSDFWPYDRLMEAVLKMWQGYRNLKVVAEARGKKILNATEGGYLDVFPRARYESLFADKKTVR